MKAISWLKRKSSFHTLRTQLIFYYMLICLVVLSVGSYFIYVSILDIIKGQNEKYLMQQFRQVEYNLQSIIDEVDGVSKLFLLDDSVQQLLVDNLDSMEFEVVNTKKNIVNRITDFTSNYSFLNSIYIFTENKGLLGGSLRNTALSENDDVIKRFLSSSLYTEAKQLFPKTALDGGLSEKDFNRLIFNSNDYLISLARTVKPISDVRKSATIVLNVKERYVASVYSETEDDKEGNLYIVNDKNIIISSNDESRIGEEGAYPQIVLSGEQFGSSIVEDSVQVVFYRLKNPNWYMFKEIPLNTFSQEIFSLQKVVIYVFLLSMLLIFMVSYYLLRKMTEPLKQLVSNMSAISSGKLGLIIAKIPKNEFGLVVKRFNDMSLSIVDLIDKNKQIQEEKRKTEIMALQAQINPHFIYNTLNMIKWMAAVSKAKNIYESIVALGNIIRPAFKSTDPMCSLKEEVDYLNNYLKIMNWRMGNKINYRHDLPEHLQECRIPRFILQPIIENAVTHGIKNQINDLLIHIDISENDRDLIITISDTGCGIELTALKELQQMSSNPGSRLSGSKKGIGIYNVNQRLLLSFGERYGVQIFSSDGEGTKVIITLPKITE